MDAVRVRRALHQAIRIRPVGDGVQAPAAHPPVHHPA
jgi:hypothetical protein